MANSNFFSATNSVLQLATLPPVQTAAIFDAGITTGQGMTKYQNAAAYKIDFAQRHLNLKMTTAFTKYKFLLNIFQGTTDYILDTGINAENLAYHSWFNITAGSPYAAPLKLITYEDYTSQWPDQTVIQQGPPLYVVNLPYDRQLDSGNPMPRIRIFPIPDATYQLQYQASLNATLLTSGSTPSQNQLLWPPQYEHGLWMWAWNMLEVDLAEGREAQLNAMVDDVVSRIRVQSQNAEEVRKAVRIMHYSGRRRRGYGSGYFY